MKRISILTIVCLTVVTLLFLPQASGTKAGPGASQSPQVSNGIGCSKKCDQRIICDRLAFTRSFILTENQTELLKVPQDGRFTILRIYANYTPDQNSPVNWDQTLWQLKAGNNLFLDELGIRIIDYSKPFFGLTKDDFPDGTVVAGPGQSLIVLKPQSGVLRMTIVGYFSACIIDDEKAVQD